MERPPIRRRRTPPMGRIRPRSQSVWPTSTPSSALSATSLARSLSYLPSPLPPSLITAATGTVESLDLPTSLPALVASLRAFLLGNVQQVEDRLRYLSDEVGSSTEDDDLDDDALFSGPAVVDDGARSNKGKGRQIIAPLPPADEAAPGQVAHFVAQVRAYLRSIKADLFTAEELPPAPEVVRSPARDRGRAASLSSAEPQRPKLAYLGRSRSQSPATTNALPTRSTVSDVPAFCPSPTPFDEALASPTVPSTFAIPDSRHLLATLSAHSEKVQELLAQVSLYCRSRSLSLPVTPSVSTAGPVLAAKRLLDSVPSFSSMHLAIPSRPPLPSPAVALGSYFAAESERLAQLVGPLHLAERSESVKTTLRSALHEGEERLREEKDRLKEWVEGEGERLKGWVDAEAEKFRAAVRAGKERLLNYQELPIDWRNNEYILSGYRFIPAERWQDLLLSGVQWHNETGPSLCPLALS